MCRRGQIVLAALVLAIVVVHTPAAAPWPRKNSELKQQQFLHADRTTNASVPVSWPAFLIAKVQEIPDALERISVDVSYDNLWEEIITFPERQPYTFNIGLATVKTFTADLIVQLGSARQHSSSPIVDWRRSAAFATFGCLYVGLAQWFFLISLFSVLCPHAIRFANEPMAQKIHDSLGQHDLVRQVFYDNFILEAFIYFPVFYTIKEAINTLCAPSPTVQPATSADLPLAPMGRRSPLATTLGILFKGLGTYRRNFFQDNSLSCFMWIPGDLMIYSAPMFLRMPLDHALSFIWTMGLSYMRGGATQAPKDEANTAQKSCD